MIKYQDRQLFIQQIYKPQNLQLKKTISAAYPNKTVSLSTCLKRWARVGQLISVLQKLEATNVESIKVLAPYGSEEALEIYLAKPQQGLWLSDRWLVYPKPYDEQQPFIIEINPYQGAPIILELIGSSSYNSELDNLFIQGISAPNLRIETSAAKLEQLFGGSIEVLVFLFNQYYEK
jgi:hypothetical protein